MKFFAAGISTESNTFSPIPTGIEDFRIQRPADYAQGRTDSAGFDLQKLWGTRAQARGDAFVFGLMAKASPSGTTVRPAYESLRDELLDELRAAMPVDIVLLMLHGAMLAHGYDDCEEDIIRRVRAIVGPKCVIAVELDLHCHVSRAKIDQADLVITYKHYPHIDVNDRARELFDLAVATKLGQVRPVMELFDCRMIGLYPTTRQPLSDFVEALSAAESRPGVLSVSFAHGYQWADVPHMGSKLLLITDNDAALAKQVAEELGQRVYGIRKAIAFDAISLPLEQAFTRALAVTKGPVVIADQSDNVGAGAPGDSTYALRWLLEHPRTDAALAMLYDPEVVKIARKAGKGATVRVRLGGKLSAFSGSPLDLDVVVTSTLDRYVHQFPQGSGEASRHFAGDVVALRAGGIDVVVSSERCQCFDPSIFFDLGIDATRKQLLIVKSMQHFYASFARIASQIVYMSAPGATAPDPKLNSYTRVQTNRLYPWIDDPLAADAPRYEINA